MPANPEAGRGTSRRRIRITTCASSTSGIRTGISPSTSSAEYLFGDQVRLKKYFYVLRPLLAIRYIEGGRGIPPVAFEELVSAVSPEELREPIAALLALKRSTGELGLGEPIPAIGKFIEAELERHGTLFSGQGRPELAEGSTVRQELNEIFRTAVREDG